MHIEFYSYDSTIPGSFPGYVTMMSIDYEIAPNITDLQSVTLPSEEYEIYLAQNVTENSYGWQGETIYGDM